MYCWLGSVSSCFKLHRAQQAIRIFRFSISGATLLIFSYASFPLSTRLKRQAKGNMDDASASNKVGF